MIAYMVEFLGFNDCSTSRIAQNKFLYLSVMNRSQIVEQVLAAFSFPFKSCALYDQNLNSRVTLIAYIIVVVRI
jgi:hypothetical protein